MQLVGGTGGNPPATGLEPVTYRLTAGRSAIELRGNGKEILPKRGSSVNRYSFLRRTVARPCLAGSACLSGSVAPPEHLADNRILPGTASS